MLINDSHNIRDRGYIQQCSCSGYDIFPKWRRSGKHMRIVAVLSCRDQYFHPWLCQIMIQLRPICYKDLCSLLVWSITLSKHVKSPVYEFTDWKLPLVAFTHLIRNSFTTCRGSFNYLLMTETWKLYHVHYKRSIYTSQSTLSFIPLASLDSHMA